MRFRKTSQFVATSVFGALVMMLALSASSAHAAVLSWDFDISPTAESTPMREYVGDTNDGTRYVGSGGWGVGAGLICNGFAEYAEQHSNDSLNMSGDYGFVYTDSINGPHTIEFNVKSLVDDDGRSMAFTQAAGDANGSNGRGIRLLSNSLRVVGGSELANYSVPTLGSAFNLFRISLPNTGTATFYRYNGSTWDLLGSVTSLGHTNVPVEMHTAGQVTAGVGVGSLSGSGVQSGKFQIDYVRIDNANALTTQAPLTGPSEISVCREAVTPTGTQALTGAYNNGPNLPFASVDLGTTNVSNGIATPYNAGDGIFTAVTHGGRDCHTATGNFMYFDVTATPHAALIFTVDYYDTDDQSLNIEYDGVSSDYQAVSLVNMVTNGAGGSWKTATVSITDAQFNNGENGGSEFRISGSGGLAFYLDKVSLSETNPTTTYTVSNTGNLTNTFNWTASSSDCSGGTGPTWLTVNVASGSLTPCSTATVIATANPNSPSVLAVGTYTGYVKFTSDCSTSACLTEPFTYSNGNIVANSSGAWTSATFGHNEYNIVSNQLKVDGSKPGGNGNNNVKHTVSCTAGEGVTSVSVTVKQGGDANPNPGSVWWRFRANDTAGKTLGFWQGGDTSVYAKNPGDINEITTIQSITGSALTMEMRLQAGCKKVSYYFNGSLLINSGFNATDGHNNPGTATDYDFESGSTGEIASVQFETFDSTSSGTDNVLFDDLTVSALSSFILRRVDLNVVGCSLEVLEPRIRVRGPCNPTATTTETYTIRNNGSIGWTGYSATENPEDDDWMTVSYTSSPVTQNSTATVTATIDWSQVPTTGAGQNHQSRIRFSATCDGGSTFVDETPSDGTLPPTDPDYNGGAGKYETVNVLDTTPAPVKIIYNGDQSPSNANSAGTGYKFYLWSGIDQGSITADGQADDGLAYLLNDAGGAGLKTKWESVSDSDPGNGSVPAMVINRYVGATAMSRLKVTATSGTTFQYNFGIQNSAGAIGAFCYWGGATNLIMESARGVSAAPAGDANYHIIRMTSQDTNVPGLGIVVNMYLDENSSPVLTITNGATSSGDSNIDGIAFGAASSAESATVYFDWVWGTNAGAFAPGEEVSCIGSLVCSGCNCNTPKVDADGDGDVDMDDFGEFQKCYTGSLSGSPPPLSAACDCFDNDNDNDIDVSDFNHFVDCETGASVPWVTSVPCPN